MRVTTTCRSCPARVWWAITDRGRKRMLINRDPVPHGNVIEVGQSPQGPVVHVLGRDEEPPAHEPRYVSHFATCPNAKEHRG